MTSALRNGSETKKTHWFLWDPDGSRLGVQTKKFGTSIYFSIHLKVKITSANASAKLNLRVEEVKLKHRVSKVLETNTLGRKIWSLVFTFLLLCTTKSLTFERISSLRQFFWRTRWYGNHSMSQPCPLWMTKMRHSVTFKTIHNSFSRVFKSPCYFNVTDGVEAADCFTSPNRSLKLNHEKLAEEIFVQIIGNSWVV